MSGVCEFRRRGGWLVVLRIKPNRIFSIGIRNGASEKKAKNFYHATSFSHTSWDCPSQRHHPGAAGSDIRNLTVSNGKLFFRANDGVNGDELWKSDGTAVGTVMVKDINPAGDAFFWVSTTLRPSPEV